MGKGYIDRERIKAVALKMEAYSEAAKAKALLERIEVICNVAEKDDDIVNISLDEIRDCVGRVMLHNARLADACADLLDLHEDAVKRIPINH